jgi:hypothetical protein
MVVKRHRIGADGDAAWPDHSPFEIEQVGVPRAAKRTILLSHGQPYS